MTPIGKLPKNLTLNHTFTSLKFHTLRIPPVSMEPRSLDFNAVHNLKPATPPALIIYYIYYQKL